MTFDRDTFTFTLEGPKAEVWWDSLEVGSILTIAYVSKGDGRIARRLRTVEKFEMVVTHHDRWQHGELKTLRVDCIGIEQQ